MTTLIVVAHPDDEVLGAGGMAAKRAASGAAVQACILSGEVEARENRPPVADLHADAERANRLLGLPVPIFGSFPNISFNTVPHLELVRFIERVMRDTGATELFTHHPADLNDDHRYTAHAAQVAARLHQRDRSVPRLKRLAFMEVLSSTDWAFPSQAAGFVPNAFVEIGNELIERKIAALSAYRGVVRPFPHSRSVEGIRALALLRGAQSGLECAEAFQVVFEQLDAR